MDRGNEKVYNKLIRDGIPAIIKADGKSYAVKQLSEEDYRHHLYRKLKEETEEFLSDDSLEELADITEVIYAILELKGSDPGELEKIRKKKFEKRGGFAKRLLLQKVVG